MCDIDQFLPTSGESTESPGIFTSAENAVASWVTYMAANKAADVEDIIYPGRRGCGLVFRCTDALRFIPLIPQVRRESGGPVHVLASD